MNDMTKIKRLHNFVITVFEVLILLIIVAVIGITIIYAPQSLFAGLVVLAILVVGLIMIFWLNNLEIKETH
jgi:hypothetical protein